MQAELETLGRACRLDPARLDAFLAPDFHEFGASGGELTRSGTADRVAASTADGGDDLVPEQVRGQLVADGVVMVKYRLSANGRTTHRTSLWRRTTTGTWEMFHHQGTVVPPEAGTSRHLSVVVRRSPADVYAYAVDPAHLPRWAHGLAESEVHVEDGALVVDSPMGRVRIAFVERNDLGVLDHDVTLPDGTVVTNPLRVLAHPDGAEVLFTVRRLDLTDEAFERDCATVLADLDRLRGLLESAG